MNFIDLCAGIGGFSLGLEMAGMTCAGQVEIDDYCNRVLEKHWPDVPRWRDVKTINPADLPTVELICGGYPCQPFSSAGKRKGQEDDRHLWPFILPIITEKRPTWCLFENVVGHITLGIDQVLSDLESVGYSCQALIIPACAVNAQHRRNRLWIIANTMCSRSQKFFYKYKQPVTLSKTRTPAEISHNITAKRVFGLTDSKFVRRDNGVPHRVDRIRGLGNAVVPQLVYEIGRAILQAHSEEES